MLFRKKIERSCSHCAYGVRLDDDSVLCSKKGMRSILGKCRKFKYDPIKRVPKKPRPLSFDKYNDDDFKL